MAYENLVVLLGDIAKEAEMRTAGERPVANFRVVVKERYKEKEYVDYISVSAWGELAERCQKLKLGEPVFIRGKLKVRAWQDRDSGASRSLTEVSAQSVVSMAGAPPKTTAGAEPDDDMAWGT